jgi:hypothetical protein
MQSITPTEPSDVGLVRWSDVVGQIVQKQKRGRKGAMELNSNEDTHRGRHD